MILPVIIRPAADQDIQEAFQLSEAIEPGLGPRLLANIDRVVEIIAEHPLAYPTYHRTARRAVIRQSPFLLYYVPRPDRVYVVACFSGRRNPRWIKRALRQRNGT